MADKLIKVEHDKAELAEKKVNDMRHQRALERAQRLKQAAMAAHQEATLEAKKAEQALNKAV